MYLLDMNGQTTSGIQATGTHITLEVLGLLVLHKNYIHQVSYDVSVR